MTISRARVCLCPQRMFPNVYSIPIEVGFPARRIFEQFKMPRCGICNGLPMVQDLWWVARAITSRIKNLRGESRHEIFAALLLRSQRHTIYSYQRGYPRAVPAESGSPCEARRRQHRAAHRCRRYVTSPNTRAPARSPTALKHRLTQTVPRTQAARSNETAGHRQNRPSVQRRSAAPDWSASKS